MWLGGLVLDATCLVWLFGLCICVVGLLIMVACLCGLWSCMFVVDLLIVLLIYF